MTPTKNESLPELVARWRAEADAATNHENQAFVRGCISGTRVCADELEAALTREAPTEAVSDALRSLLNAVCGETGFAEAVRSHSGLAYPWPALDIAEEKARAALAVTPPAPQRMAQGEECAATHAGHKFGPHGPKGAIQCEYCGEPPHQDRGEEVERALTAAMREADALHERVGGGTRHYVRDCLLPILKKHGLTVAALTEAKQQGPGEAVAWLCTSEDGSSTQATCEASMRDTYARFGRTITPLYAAPQVEAKRQTGEGDAS